MLRQTFILVSFLAALNLYFAEAIELQFISGLVLLISLGISVIWPEPLPPPPPPDYGQMHQKRKIEKWKIALTVVRQLIKSGRCALIVLKKYEQMVFCNR